MRSDSRSEDQQANHALYNRHRPRFLADFAFRFADHFAGEIGDAKTYTRIADLDASHIAISFVEAKQVRRPAAARGALAEAFRQAHVFEPRNTAPLARSAPSRPL